MDAGVVSLQRFHVPAIRDDTFTYVKRMHATNINGIHRASSSFAIPFTALRRIFHASRFFSWSASNTYVAGDILYWEVARLRHGIYHAYEFYRAR